MFIAVSREKKTILILLLVYFSLLFIILFIYGKFGAGIWFCLSCMAQCFAHAMEIANELTWGLYKAGIVSSCVPTKGHPVVRKKS